MKLRQSNPLLHLTQREWRRASAQFASRHLRARNRGMHVHAMKVVLRETVEIRVGQKKERVPRLRVQNTQSVLSQQQAHAGDIAPFQQQSSRSTNDVHRSRKCALRAHHIQCGQFAVTAKALRATADAESPPHFVQIYIAYSAMR